MSSAASDITKANEAVQRAIAMVRAATGQLRNPLPAKGKSLTSDLLGPLLSPLQGQMPLLELNPLNAEAMSELAAKAAQYVQKVRAEDSAQALSARQLEFARTLAMAAKKKQLTPEVLLKASEHLYGGAKSGDTPKTVGKLTLVKPMRDVHSQLAALFEHTTQFEQTTQPAMSSLQKQHKDTRDTSRNINEGIAPRASAGRSGEATLGKLLQQLEVLANDALLDLAGRESMGDMAARMFGPQGKSTATERKAKSPQSLARLADIVGDLWQQTFSSPETASSGAAQKTAPVRRNTQAGVRLPRMANGAAAENAMTPDDKASVSPSTTNLPLPPAPAGGSTGNNAGAAPVVDVYALANGLNDVLREQAWLAGVDLT
jgi:hypothetical protein